MAREYSSNLRWPDVRRGGLGVDTGECGLEKVGGLSYESLTLGHPEGGFISNGAKGGQQDLTVF
jgi:hypothetical protein